MVQFYNVDNPLRDMSQGFLDQFGEGLKFKINQSRFQDAIGNVEKEMAEGKFENPAQLVMSLVKNVGHLQGGPMALSEMVPALLRYAQDKGMGALSGSLSNSEQSVEQQMPKEMAMPSQQEPHQRQQAPVVATPQGQVISQAPSGRTQQETPVPVPKEQGDQKDLMSFIDQSVGFQPNLSKSAPSAPLTPPKLRAPLTSEQRSQIHQNLAGKGVPWEGIQRSLDAYDQAIENENRFAVNNYNMNEQYRQNILQHSEALYNQASNQVKPQGFEEEAALNKIAQQEFLKNENPNDAMPNIKKRFDRFRKIRHDVTEGSKIGSSEWISSVVGGEPLGDLAKRKLKFLSENAKTYKEYGLEDNFRQDASAAGWPEFATDMALDPISKDQMRVLDQITQSQTPTKKPAFKGNDFKKLTAQRVSGAPSFVPVEPPELIENQKNEMLGDLWGVLNNPAMKDMSLHVIRQAFMEKGYNFRAFANALTELTEKGQVQLQGLQSATAMDMNHPPLEGLDSIMQNGFFNTVKGAIFNVK